MHMYALESHTKNENWLLVCVVWKATKGEALNPVTRVRGVSVYALCVRTRAH